MLKGRDYRQKASSEVATTDQVGSNEGLSQDSYSGNSPLVIILSQHCKLPLT